MPSPRAIPSIDRLLARPALTAAAARHGRAAVTDAVRRAAEACRTAARTSDAATAGEREPEAAAAAIEADALSALEAAGSASLVPVINATGVIIHTNLGRAPLAAEAVTRLAEIARGYSNLEYDLAAGARGHRHVHAERLLRDLTGAEAALIANNNAAAMLLVLTALAAGREVIVSRGELVEIGGGFRVPDVLAQSGAALREVGTTNRTRTADYAAAIGDKTALLLRVHPSNFTIAGFTERPTLDELVALGRRFNLPVVEDLGSGWLGAADDDLPDALRAEPSVRASLGAGADIVAFSGDKLLGGPQAGVVVGRAALLDRVRRHPLMRAVRADKLVYAALEATLALWAREPSRTTVPTYRMITEPIAAVDGRARALAERVRTVPGLRAEVREGLSTIGGGSAPGSSLRSRVVALTVDGMSAATLHERLRTGTPAVVARIEDDRLLCDLRTVADDEVDALADAVGRAARERS